MKINKIIFTSFVVFALLTLSSFAPKGKKIPKELLDGAVTLRIMTPGDMTEELLEEVLQDFNDLGITFKDVFVGTPEEYKETNDFNSLKENGVDYSISITQLNKSTSINIAVLGGGGSGAKTNFEAVDHFSKEHYTVITVFTLPYKSKDDVIIFKENSFEKSMEKLQKSLE